MEPTIQVGQVWQDLDLRNSKVDKKNRGKHRQVKILSLPTLSQKGVMEVVSAPQNPGSVGQKREYTRAKLLYYYGLVKGA